MLVAEDSPTQRQIIKTVLSHEGFDVVMASDGIEAVTQTLQENPDLVVLDIEMPKMNGYQVCRLLKDDRRTSHIPIIMLTSRSQETDKFWGLKTGADRYVTKDFQLAGLAGTVNDLLKQERVAQGAPAPSAAPFGSDAYQDMDVDVLSRVNELLDRKLYEATVINEISKLNTLSEDCGATVSSVLALIANVTDCHIASVFLLEEMELIMHIHEPISKSYFIEAKRQVGDAVSPHLPAGADPSQAKVILDADPAFLRDDLPGPEVIKSVLTLPLNARGDLIAYLVLSSPRPDAFNEDIQRIIEIIENPVSLVVDNARLHESTRQLAVTDGLTKLLNHRHFYELLDQEFQRALRYQINLSLIMIDIDSFKQINDSFGHQVGDEVLKSLASVITKEVRDIDFVARYGGEEFALLLPETECGRAREVAERIRGSVENHDFNLPNGGKVTISLGVAGFPGCGANNQHEMVQIADAALYEAKAAGKNRVMIGADNGATEKI